MGGTSLQLSLRFAALYSCLTALVLIGAYLFTRFELSEWIDEDLRSAEIALTGTYEAGGLDLLSREIALRVTSDPDGHMIFRLTGPDGTVLAGNIVDTTVPADGSRIPRDAFTLDPPVDDEITEFAIRTLPLGDATLVIGQSTHLYLEAIEALSIVLVAGFGATVLIGLGAGLLVGRRTERRITGIRSTLTEVAGGRLQSRVGVRPGRTDDLTRVSVAINGALDRLQTLVESQQQISVDIAHDLRTPIQRLRQRLERMRGAPADPADTGTPTADAIDQAISEVDTIIGTFQALLRIAQIEGGARRARFGDIDLSEICQNVADAYGVVAEDAGHDFATRLQDGPAVVRGDGELLTQLVANLVENAIRHCPSGARIRLSLAPCDDETVLQVSDTGPGIAPAERRKVFRRLYRVEKSRTRPGSGLGLSLVRAIVDLHGAEIELTDNNPGLNVVVRFTSRFPHRSRFGLGECRNSIAMTST